MEDIPEKILGYSIKTRWQISLNYLIPCIVELAVYITVIVVDGALVYQHFLDENIYFATTTLALLIVPAFLTFIITILSPDQIIGESKLKSMIHLIGIQFLYLLIFPLCAIHRFSRKIFWCVESLFHEKNTYERHTAISKAAENSQFELYHFLQSFFHCGPQIMFQLFIILRDDMFRNYDTAFVQALSIIFGLIKMSMTAESYQRFESQKIVGKNYPWHTMTNKTLGLRKAISATDIRSCEIQEELRNEDLILSNDLGGKTHEEGKTVDFLVNITDDEKLTRNLNDENTDKFTENNMKMVQTNEADEVDSPQDEQKHNELSFLRNNIKRPFDETMHRLSAIKHSILVNTESFIKEKIPRAPEHIFGQHDENEAENKRFLEKVDDNVDGLKLPTRREMTAGIESDDIVAKFVAFLGWNFFLLMRLMSLSVFAVFHLDICGWLVFFHYCLMLLMLLNETRFHVKWQRTAFYTILAYIFIFTLIEFKVKFKKVRFWYISYFIIVFVQNFAMTLNWYVFEEYLDTWWYEFMFLLILQSGIMSLMCFLIYFFYLKPRDKLILS